MSAGLALRIEVQPYIPRRTSLPEIDTDAPQALKDVLHVGTDKVASHAPPNSRVPTSMRTPLLAGRVGAHTGYGLHLPVRAAWTTNGTASIPPNAMGPMAGGSCFNPSGRRQSGTLASARAAASCSSLVGFGVFSSCPLASASLRTAPLLCATADRMMRSPRLSGAEAEVAEAEGTATSDGSEAGAGMAESSEATGAAGSACTIAGATPVRSLRLGALGRSWRLTRG